VQTIQFGDDGQAATRELAARFERFATAAPLDAGVIARVRDGFAALQVHEKRRARGPAMAIDSLEDVVATLVVELARLDDPDFVIGIALWAIRHGITIAPVEDVVNALALRSNRAAGKSEIAAVYGLMQGVIAHVAPLLAADLERSNPERPWRILHVNFAITAIRTEDPALMDFAFDALDAALPDEAAGFYAEALALALSPRIAPAVRERIENRCQRPFSAG
jgi:hypothetical protein